MKAKTKKIKYQNYKTTEGYIRTIANEMKETIIHRYKNFKVAVEKKIPLAKTEHPEPAKTDKEILRLFRGQVKKEYEELMRRGKLKVKELPGKKEKGTRKWASAAGVDRAIKTALRSGAFTDIKLQYGENVIQTLKEAGMGRLFRDELARAKHAQFGGKFKYGKADPLNFRPAEDSEGKSQTVLYIEDGEELISIDLTWSPASATITNLVTGRSTTQLIEEDKQEDTKDVD